VNPRPAHDGVRVEISNGYPAMAAMVLEQHNHETLHNPSWAAVESALRGIDPKHRGFFILSRGDAGYLQAAGARLRMICEWRQSTEAGAFRHFVLGRPDRDTMPSSINTCVGIIQLQRNEILSLNDVVAAFKSYYECGTVPERFSLRDDTARFGEPAVG
jgi:hypothetical protein